MNETETKSSWFLEVQKIVYFWFKIEVYLFLFSIFFTFLNIILTGTLSNVFTTVTIKLYLEIQGGISILCGFLFLAFFSMTSDRRYVVRTAARFRAPNQLSYSRDILKRQMDDWHRAIGGVLLFIFGFLVLGTSYVAFG